MEMAIELIVIHCQAPDYTYAKTFSVIMPNEMPICENCRQMMVLTDRKPLRPWNGQEIWQCPHCHHEGQFWYGSYGEREIEMTEEEYTDYVQHRRTVKLLEKRYGDNRPAHIADYWLTNETSE